MMCDCRSFWPSQAVFPGPSYYHQPQPQPPPVQPQVDLRAYYYDYSYPTSVLLLACLGKYLEVAVEVRRGRRSPFGEDACLQGPLVPSS